LTQLWSAYASASSGGYAVEFYYGLASGNFYSVVDCHSPGYIGSTACVPGTRFTFTARNFVFFKDQVIHFWRTDGNGNLVGTSFGKGTATYDPTGRPWFLQGSGWTGTYFTYENGVLGKTYYKSFSGGVAGGDRYPSEPCSACLMGSFPVPWSAYWSAHQAGGASLTTVVQIQDYARDMIAAVRSYTDEIFSEIHVGFENNVSYTLADCNHANQKCRPGYYFYARNDFVYGNQSLIRYHLDINGRLDASGQMVIESFWPHAQPWYIISDGWTDLYTSATSGTVVRSFSLSFDGGVASANLHQFTSLGFCYKGRNGDYPPGYYTSGGNQLAAAIPLALLGLLFRLW